MKESISRSVTKAVTFRIIVVILDFVILYWLTGRLDLTLGFVTLTTIVRTIVYFVHERIWNRMHWGKTHPGNK